MSGKIMEYVRRYGPGEVAATCLALGGYSLARAFTDNEIGCAYAAALGENLGFYGTTFVREFRSDVLEARRNGTSYRPSSALRTAANLASEFGPAEAADSLVVRPGVIATSLYLMGNNLGGAFVGKVLSDGVFYAIAASSRELRKRWLGK